MPGTVTQLYNKSKVHEAHLYTGTLPIGMGQGLKTDRAKNLAKKKLMECLIVDEDVAYSITNAVNHLFYSTLCRGLHCFMPTIQVHSYTQKGLLQFPHPFCQRLRYFPYDIQLLQWVVGMFRFYKALSFCSKLISQRNNT